MSLPKYAEYKDSGVAWLGSVPAHWDVRPLKFEAKLLTSNVDKKSYEDEVPIFLCNYTDVYYNDRIVHEMDFMPATASSSQIERFTLRAGDTIITKDSETADDIAISAYVPSDLPGVVCGYHLAVVRPDSISSGPYNKYLFDCHFLKAYFEVSANGLTRVGLSQGTLGGALIPCPSDDERGAIATFLDGETGKIDALIAEQEKLLTLLAEKRQATISHAVTRGLNPSAPMKDSGVPWLGEVPAHWDVKSLKYVIADSKAGPFGSAITKDMYVSEGYRVYGQEQVIPADFSKGDYFIDEHKYLELQQYRVAAGDVLISCVGTFGKIAIVPEDVHPGVINPRLIRLRVADDVSADFLVTVLRSAVVFEQFSLLSRGGTMDVINIGTLSGIDLAVPPHEEQLAIVHFTVREAAKLDALKDEADHMIALLKERRSALIAAAVTGKIDVRGQSLAMEVHVDEVR